MASFLFALQCFPFAEKKELIRKNPQQSLIRFTCECSSQLSRIMDRAPYSTESSPSAAFFSVTVGRIEVMQ